MAQRVNLGVGGLPTRARTYVAKTAPAAIVPNYKLVVNPITGQLDRVVNNISVLKAVVDAVDPTGEGVAGRAAITLGDGSTVYLALYNSP